MHSRIEDEDCRRIAEELQLDYSEVKRAVQSFFGVIVSRARKLPFDNHRKIYTRDKFDEYAFVYNLPSLGRIGPSYTRYLRWRANESRQIEQTRRSSYRVRLSQDEIEHIAAEILSGRTPQLVKQKKGNELFNRVWMVGKEGKKQARQVIPKK